jgi:hypothetical protein
LSRRHKDESADAPLLQITAGKHQLQGLRPRYVVDVQTDGTAYRFGDDNAGAGKIGDRLEYGADVGLAEAQTDATDRAGGAGDRLRWHWL